MGVGDRLRRLDDNALADITYEQATAPFSWWSLTAFGLVGLVLSVLQRDIRGAGAAVVMTAVGAALSTLTRRRDRRLEEARRDRVERDMRARQERQRQHRSRS